MLDPGGGGGAKGSPVIVDYVVRYRVGLPEAFLRHMETLSWVPPVLSTAQLDELTEALLS